MNVPLTPEQLAEAKQLEEKIRHAISKEIETLAQLVVSKPERELFGETEYQVRDIVLRIGAKVFEEHLREKKTATTAQESVVPSAASRPSSTPTAK